MTSAPPIAPNDVRAPELQTLATLLLGESRLLTLTGPVGVGKSWLAARAAERALAAGAVSGVLRIDLERAVSMEDVLARAALSLGLAPREAADPDRERRRIAAAIEQRAELLVLLDGADEALDVLRGTWLDELQRDTEARFVITARARLGVSGEHVVEIAPLLVPQDNDLEAPAARFFLDRVRERTSTYSPTAAEAPLLAELVRELDGLPLAMELAAPRLALMGAAPLLHRLRSSRSILRGRAPAARHRHESFDAALEGSWMALKPWERDALAGLTAFATFDIDGAEATLDLARHKDAPAIIDLLQALRDRSLIAVASNDVAGAVRLRLLASVADFVRRRADRAIVQSAGERHARQFGELARRWCKELDGPTSRDALAAIDRERDNLMLVVQRVLTTAPVTVREAEPALWSLLALAPGLEPHPTLAAHAPILERVLDATQNSGADPTLLARAFGLRSAFRRRAGDLTGATRDLSRALRLAESLGATSLEGALFGELAMVVEASGDLDAATLEAEKAIERLAAISAWAEESRALLVLARLEGAKGDAKRSRALALRALALADAHGLAREKPRAHLAVARALVDLGAWDEARLHLADARSKDDTTRALCDEIEGRCRHEEGDLARAAELYAAAASAARRAGLVVPESRALMASALVAIERRSFAESYALLTVAVDVAKGTDVALLRALLGAVVRLDSDAGAFATTSLPAPIAPLDRALATFLSNATDVGHLEHARADLLTTWSSSSLARLTVRALERSLASPGAQPKLPKDALVIGTAGRWFCAPGGDAVSLERRRPLAAMLEHLAIARSERPGVAVSWSELMSAAWPGERMIAAAGAHRVRVAISTMRKLGLRERLVTTPEGYALDVTCPLHRAADPPSAR